MRNDGKHNTGDGAAGGNGTTRDIPDWKLERFLLGELDEAEMAAIRRATETDAGLRARLDAMESSGRALLEKYPPDAVGREIRRRVESRGTASDAAGAGAGRDAGAGHRAAPGAGRWRGFRLRHPVLVPVAIAAAVIVVIVSHPGIITNGPPETPTGGDGTRIKGDAQSLHLYRRTADGSEQLLDGAAAAEGDVVRVQYASRDDRYGVILSADARGVITRHLPVEGSEAAVLDTKAARFLDHAYELDDAPGWEVFLFVTSDTRFPVDIVVQAIADARERLLTGMDATSGIPRGPLPALSIPEGLHEQRFTLVKKGGDGR